MSVTKVVIVDYDLFKSYNDFNQVFSSSQDQEQHPAVPAEEFSRERSLAVAVGISDRYQVTCDM